MTKKRPYSKRHIPERPSVKLVDEYLQGKKKHLKEVEKRMINECFATHPTVVYAPSQRDTLELTVQKIPETLNKRDRTHWSIKAYHRSVWDGIMTIVKDGIPYNPVDYPLLLEMTCHRISLRDADNNAASAKDIIDALVHLGILANDDPPHVAFYVAGQVKVKHKAEQKTIIRLTHIPDGYTVRLHIEKENGGQVKLPT